MKRIVFNYYLLLILFCSLLFAGCSGSDKKNSPINMPKEVNAVENSETKADDYSEPEKNVDASYEKSSSSESSTDNSNSIFIVKFNLDGGTRFNTYNYKSPTVYSYSLTVKNGETYGAASPNKKLPGASRTGYLFNGWYTKKDGNGQKIAENTLVELKYNIEVFAYWKESVKVNYQCINSFACTSGIFYINKGLSVKDFSDDSRVNIMGYEFDGFFKDGDGKEKYLDDYIFQNDDMVYPKHTALIYKVYVRSIGNGQVAASANTISTDGSVNVVMIPYDGYAPTIKKICHGSYDSENGCQEVGMSWLDNNYETGFNYTEASGEGDLYITITFTAK